MVTSEDLMHIFIFMILKLDNQLLKKYMTYSRKSLIEIVLFLLSLSIFSYFFFKGLYTFFDMCQEFPPTPKVPLSGEFCRKGNAYLLRDWQ